MNPTTSIAARDWHRWACDCIEPAPGWWAVECRRCYRPILAELDRILTHRRELVA